MKNNKSCCHEWSDRTDTYNHCMSCHGALLKSNVCIECGHPDIDGRKCKKCSVTLAENIKNMNKEINLPNDFGINNLVDKRKAPGA